MYHGLRGIRYSHTVTHNANCTAFSKTLPLSECSTTKSHALGTKPESLWGSVSMHEMYGQPPPNPLLAAKKHHSHGHGDNADFAPTIWEWLSFSYKE